MRLSAINLHKLNVEPEKNSERVNDERNAILYYFDEMVYGACRRIFG